MKRKPVTIEGISAERRAQLKADIDSLYEPDPDSPYERKRIKRQSQSNHGQVIDFTALANQQGLSGALMGSQLQALAASQQAQNQLLSQQAIMNAQGQQSTGLGGLVTASASAAFGGLF